MQEILLNPWFISLASGIIITLLSRFSFSKGVDKEYLQNVKLANKEVIDAIRPTISNEKSGLPSLETVISLISACSRKYNVDRGSMYSLQEIVHELVKEVMDSSFISSETKHRYCELLYKMIDGKDKTHSTIEKKKIEFEYKEKMLNSMSLILGAVTTFMTLTIVLGDLNSSLRSIYEYIKVFIPGIITVLSILVINFLMLLFKGGNKKNNEKYKKTRRPKQSRDKETNGEL